MVSLINKQLLLTAYAYLFIMEQQKFQQGSEALQIKGSGCEKQTPVEEPQTEEKKVENQKVEKQTAGKQTKQAQAKLQQKAAEQATQQQKAAAKKKADEKAAAKKKADEKAAAKEAAAQKKKAEEEAAATRQQKATQQQKAAEQATQQQKVAEEKKAGDPAGNILSLMRNEPDAPEFLLECDSCNEAGKKHVFEFGEAGYTNDQTSELHHEDANDYCQECYQKLDDMEKRQLRHVLYDGGVKWAEFKVVDYKRVEGDGVKFFTEQGNQEATIAAGVVVFARPEVHQVPIAGLGTVPRVQIVYAAGDSPKRGYIGLHEHMNALNAAARKQLLDTYGPPDGREVLQPRKPKDQWGVTDQHTL